MKLFTAIALTYLIAATAYAHDGVANPFVKARMEAMMGMRDNMKSLGMMMQGKVEFDAETAGAALGSIAEHARQTPALFAEPANDPKSEAKENIWTNFDEFSGLANKLDVLASELAIEVSLAENLGPAMTSLGAVCKSCHADYRQ